VLARVGPPAMEDEAWRILVNRHTHIRRLAVRIWQEVRVHILDGPLCTQTAQTIDWRADAALAPFLTRALRAFPRVIELYVEPRGDRNDVFPIVSQLQLDYGAAQSRIAASPSNATGPASAHHPSPR
jgi:hypothetical protein